MVEDEEESVRGSEEGETQPCDYRTTEEVIFVKRKSLRGEK